ncbi:hypothetical protein D3C76_1013880 [compost metagenome]
MWSILTVARLVEQVEIQLAGHHRVIAVGLECVDHLDQQMAWVGYRGRHAFSGVHADLHGSGRGQPRGNTHQASLQWVGAAIDITHLPDPPRLLDVIAVERKTEHGPGQGAPALVNSQQFLAMQQLATRHAVGIEDEQLEHFDIGVLR